MIVLNYKTVNQRTSLIVTIILGLAVIGLYVLHFTSVCSAPSKDATVADTSVVEKEIKLDNLPNLSGNSGAIAFIDFEQLTNKYQFYKDGVTNLENDYKKKQGELMKKQQTLEENYERYQQLAASLTPEVRQQREKEIMEEEKRVLDLRDRMAKDYADKEANFNKEFLAKIDTYLKGLGKEKDYSYVFTYVKGGPATIVYAKDSLNITTQVITSLNDQYKKK